MGKFLKCVLAVLIGLLATAGNTIQLAGGIIIIIPAGVLAIIMNLSKVVKDEIEKLLGVEYPWWLPFNPNWLLNKIAKFVEGTVKGFGEIWKWVKSICSSHT